MTLYLLQLRVQFQSVLQIEYLDVMYLEQCSCLGFPTCPAKTALVSQNAWGAHDAVAIPGLFRMGQAVPTLYQS